MKHCRVQCAFTVIAVLFSVYIYIYIFLRTIGKYSIDNGDFLVYFLISSSIYSVASTWDSIA